MKINYKNMSQPNSLCGIKKSYYIKALGLMAIFSFVIYMKFTLYEPLGRNDFQIISLEPNNIIHNTEIKSNTEMSDFGQIESSIFYVNYDDLQNETSNQKNYYDEIDSFNEGDTEDGILNMISDPIRDEIFSEMDSKETDLESNLDLKKTPTTIINFTNEQTKTYTNMYSDEADSIKTTIEHKQSLTEKPVIEIENIEKTDNSNVNLKYILQWSSGKKSPFYHMGIGQDHFLKFNCAYTNCFVTDNKTLLPHLTDYDAIVFNGNYVIQMDQNQLPQERSLSQKYIFGGTEPAAMKLACKPVLDNFFNWTWTYRLDSDLRWGYITIFDLNGTVVGPKPNMQWPEQMDPIDSETKVILNQKTKAAAWFVSRCKSPGRREDVVKKISMELEKFGKAVDVYGRCGNFTCPRSISDECFDLVKTDYYFYFSFENSFSVDYVTEKLLTALLNYAIPVVYGAADYSRFLPPGSYLDARVLSPQELAETMNDIINNKERYYDFFRWRNHFKYKRTEDSDDICNVCSALNDEQMMKTTSTHENFREWWNDKWHSSCKH